MDKQKSHAFGKDCYLLGKDSDGTYYWLEQAKFECSWYWGLGYVETYTNNKRPSCARDINSHQHFDGLFLNDNRKDGFDKFREFLSDSVLSEKETWTLIELMKSAYAARKYADMLYIGGSHYTTNPAAETIKNEDEYNRINNQVIPAIMGEVYKLLKP